MNKNMAFFTLLVLSAFPSLIFSFDIPITPPQRNITLTSPKKLYFPLNVSSTGSLSFDIFGGGPYVGVSDGRILKYEKLFNYFRDFSYNYPNRTKAFCDGKNGLDYPICGGPRGLAFDILGRLYCTDIFVGLTAVGPLGGLATTVVPTKNGDPYLFLLGADVDKDGIVTFTDLSSVYPPKDILEAMRAGDNTGRVLRYDPTSKKVTELLRQLALPFGVATNSNASFLLVAEFNAKRIIRYWLKGDKAGTSEIFITFQGNPNKIKRNQEGNFWVTVNNKKNDSTVDPQGVKISPSGEVLAIVDLGQEFNKDVSVIAEQGGKLYVTGVYYSYVVQYSIEYI